MQIDATGTQPVAAAGTAAAAGASAAKAAANADGDSTNRVTADRASSGDTVAAAVTAAVTAAVCGAGGESVSLSVSNSEGNRPSSTTDFVTTSQDVESGTPQATVAQPGMLCVNTHTHTDTGRQTQHAYTHSVTSRNSLPHSKACTGQQMRVQARTLVYAHHVIV